MITENILILLAVSLFRWFEQKKYQYLRYTMMVVDAKVFIHSVFDGLIIWNLQYLYKSSECNSYEKVREDLVPSRLL